MAKPQPDKAPAKDFKVNPFAGLKVAGLEPAAPSAPGAARTPPPVFKPSPGANKNWTDNVIPFADRKLAAELLRESQEKRKPVILLRMERKGRGGKTVTILRGFPDDSLTGLMDMLGRLKRDLGTGGTVQDSTLELQGDQRERGAAWLQRNGFDIKLGN